MEAPFTASAAAGRHYNASLCGSLIGSGHHVKPLYLVPRLHEVGRHRQAHITEPDKTNYIRHSTILPYCGASRPRAMMTRMISFVPSRIWCTRKSRTIFSIP